MQKRYLVEMEVSGPLGMFKRPDAWTSYPVPTTTAAKAIFEQIARLRTAYIKPVSCRICSPVEFIDHAFNYGGAMRESRAIREGTNLQVRQKFLYGPCFQLVGEVVEVAPSPIGVNQSHYLQDKFNRRLRKGECWGRNVFIGTSECVAEYFGPPRPESKVVPHDETVFGFLVGMWDSPVDGKLKPSFATVEIRKGVLVYV